MTHPAGICLWSWAAWIAPWVGNVRRRAVATRALIVAPRQGTALRGGPVEAIEEIKQQASTRKGAV